MRHFPNLIDAYLCYTRGHESTERVRKWSMISVLAACLERRVFMDRGYYTLFPNLYVFIIGKSGLIKKTTSTGIAVNLLREIEGVRIMSERLTASSLIDQLLLSGKKYEDNGVMKLQSPVFAYASELSVFLTEVFGSITELLTTFYDCVPNDSRKPWIYATVGKGEKKIYGPCLNILGASTKSWLRKCIPRSEMEGGFTSRIVFVVENKLPPRLVAWPQLDATEAETRGKLLEDLNRVYGMVGEVKPSPEARELFERWYEHHMRKVLPHTQDPRIAGYMGRKGDTILKLAIIRSVARGESYIISKQDLQWANKELETLEDDWLQAFDGLGTATPSLSYDILQYVTNRTMVKKQDVFTQFGSQHAKADIAKALNDLKSMEEIVDISYKGEEFYGIQGFEELKSLESSRLDNPFHTDEQFN